MKRGGLWCLVVLVVFSVAALPALAGGKGSTSALNCTVTNATPYGIASDGNGPYIHGTTTSTSVSVKCFLGAGGKNFDLVTYSSGRTLKFNFSDADWTAVASTASLPKSFNAEVDAFGINYYSQYLNMGENNTTAQVQMDLEFHWGGGSNTYELSYSCLAVTRTGSTWKITSEPDGSNQFAVPCLVDQYGAPRGSKATLNKIRRNSVQGFGEVSMPITITFSQQ